MSIASSLVPFDINNGTKVRLGRYHDGGYVVLEEFIGSIDNLVSCGVGSDISFEDAFMARNSHCACNLYDDKSLLHLPPNSIDPVRLHKHSAIICRELNVADITKGMRNICLKMDIEGGEYDAFMDASGSFVDVSCIDMLIIELHSITQDRRAEELIRHICREMILFHTHGNVYGGTDQVGEFTVPRVIELSFVNKRLVRGYSTTSSSYPVSGLDNSNDPERQDIQLTFIDSCKQLCVTPSDSRIPKKIHFCWMSDSPYPDDIRGYMDSWHKNLPGYEFVKWDYSRFPRGKNKFVDAAFDAKKYAFAADYIRLYSLYTEGGIYLDSDVEVIRPFDRLLDLPYFIGLEPYGTPEVGVFGFERGHPFLKFILDSYIGQEFNTETLPRRMSRVLREHNIVNNTIGDLSSFKYSSEYINLFPVSWFCASNWWDHTVTSSNDTYSVHHYAGSWL